MKSTYVISMALSNLEAVDRLYTELKKVQMLAAEGAAFNVRVSSEPIAKMRSTVAKAVAEAVAQGLKESKAAIAYGGTLPEGYFERAPAARRGEPSAGSKALLAQMNSLEQAVERLAHVIGKGVPPKPDAPTTPPGSVPDAPPAAAKPKTFKDDVLYAGLFEQQMRYMRRMQAVSFMSDHKRLQETKLSPREAVEALYGSILFLPAKLRKAAEEENRKAAEYFRKNRKVFEADPGKAETFVDLVKTRLAERSGLVKDLPAKLHATAEGLKNLRQHVLTREATLKEQGFVKGVSSTAPSVAGGGDSDAEHLVRRLVAALAGSGGEPRDLYRQASPLERKNSLIYGGINFPTTNPLELSKTEEGRQQLAYLGSIGVQYAPFSRGKAYGMEQYIARLTNEVDTGKALNKATNEYDPIDKPGIERRKAQLHDLLEQYALGGTYYTGSRNDVVNNLLVSGNELAKVNADPSFADKLTQGKLKDFSQLQKQLGEARTLSMASEFAGAMERISKVDLDPIMLAFKNMTEALIPLKANLVAIADLVDKAGQGGLKVQFDKQLKAQRIEYERELAAIKGTTRKQTTEGDVKARLAEELARGVGTGIAVPTTDSGFQELGSSVQKTLRQMSNIFQRLQASGYELQEMQRTGNLTGATSATSPLNRIVQLERGYNARLMLLTDQLTALRQGVVEGPALPAAPDGAQDPFEQWRKQPVVAGVAGFTWDHVRKIDEFQAQRGRTQGFLAQFEELQAAEAEFIARRDRYASVFANAKPTKDGDRTLQDAVLDMSQADAARRLRLETLSTGLGLSPNAANTQVSTQIQDAVTKTQVALDAEMRAQRIAGAARRKAEEARTLDDPTEVRKRWQLDRGAERAEATARQKHRERVDLQQTLVKLLDKEYEGHQRVGEAINKEVQHTHALASGLTTVAEKVTKVKTTTEATKNFFTELGHKMRTVTEYAIASGAIYSAWANLRQGFTRATALEQDLAEIQGVFLKKTEAERSAIESGVLQAGQEFGVPVAQITGTAKTFAQTGASPSEVLELTRASLTATQGAGISPELATELLIAVKEISKGTVAPANIIDRISRIEARNAVTSQDLATAIQRVGSLAAQLQPQSLGGVDAFDTVIGATTQIVEATRQTGAQAATGLKFILSRLTAPDIQKKLTEDFGIKLASNEAGTELRPIMDILGDIARLYKQLVTPNAAGETQSKRAAELLGTVAGARQVNTAAALFTDFGKVLDTARESAYSYGDAQRRLQIQLDTLRSRIEQTGNAFDAFMNRLLNNGLLGEVTKVLVTSTGKAVGASASVAGGPELVSAGLLYGGAKLFQRHMLPRAVGAAATAGGATAGATAGGIVASTAGLLPIITAVAGAFAVLGIGTMLYGIVKGDLEQRSSLYTPQKFDREAFEKSELGQGYARRATSMGTSPDALVAAVLQAEDVARQRTLQRRDSYGRLLVPEGGKVFDQKDSTPSPRLFKTYVDEFTKALSDAVPALKDVKEEAERQNVAMALLKDTVRRTNVELDTQVAGFAASAGELDQALRDSLQRGITGAFKAHAREVRIDPSSAGGLMRATSRRDPGDILATSLGQVTRLPGISTNFANPLLNAVLSDGRKLQVVAEEILAGGRSVGEALDEISNRYFLASDAARRGDGVQRMADILLPTLRDAFRKQGQFVGGDVSFAGSGGGGVFAKLFVDSYREATSRLIEELRATKTDATQAKQTLQVLEDPKSRGAFEAAVKANLDGLNARGMARDQVLDAVFRYAQQTAEIRATASASRGRLTYDPEREQASAAQNLFRGVLGTLSGFEAQLNRARARLDSLQLDQLERSYDALMEQGDMDEGVRRALSSKSYRDAYLAASTGRTAQQFAAEVSRLKTAVEDVAGNRDLFRELPVDIRRAIAAALQDGINVDNFAGTAEALRSAVTLLAEVSERRLLEREGRAIGIGLSAERRSGALRADSQQQQLALSQAQRMAELTHDLATVFTLQRRAAELAYTTAVAEAELARDRQLQELELERKFLNPLAAENKETSIRGAFDNAVAQARVELSNQVKQLTGEAALRVQELVAAQVDALREPWVSGIKNLFLENKNLSRQGLLDALDGIGASLQDRVASVFAERLVGQNGVFGDALQTLLKQEIFADQMLVRATDVTLVGESGFAPRATNPSDASYAAPSLAPGVRGAQAVAGAASSRAATQRLLQQLQSTRSSHLLPLMAAPLMAGLPLISPLSVRDMDRQGPASHLEVPTELLDKSPSLWDKTKAYGASFTGKLKASQIKDQAIFLASTLGGASVGNKTGVRGGKNYAQSGASVGATVGSLFGTPGTILGGFLGGYIGGRIGRKGDPKPPEASTLERIEANTRETVTTLENGVALRNLDQRLLNVPAGFQVPNYNPLPSFSGSSGARAEPPTQTQWTVNVTVVEAASAQSTASAVVSELRRQVRNTGTFTTTRV